MTVEKLGLKPYNSKYLKSNDHTKQAKFYWTLEKRIKIENIPDGYFRYRIRHHDNSMNIPVSLEKTVFVNHYHDVLSDTEIEYLEEDERNYIPLYKEDA
ncbi:LPD28 domain-containing protein [Enterococcus sp. AZ196]|uniref:LPD28 domain-containing protein n=1 Tax=Enterococcus sp. AZ196 TaxID=2774659 RepID=UPI003D2958B2